MRYLSYSADAGVFLEACRGIRVWLGQAVRVDATGAPGYKAVWEANVDNITISPSRDGFLRHGKPFFYLADTCWSAFTNAREHEWEEYLDLRASQGFNAVQITILPQWDRTALDPPPDPFLRDRAGSPDFLRPAPDYFGRAERMAAMARARGLVPALVVLWCDRIKDTWACKLHAENEMPWEAIEPFVRYVARVFGPHQPIWLVSGDTDFPTQATIDRYYLTLRSIKEAAPGCLTTLHLSPPTDLPDSIGAASELDFYMYQSGHGADQSLSYKLAQRFATKPVKRPVVNGEPCYEAHGHGNTYGRFGAFDVRKAIWQSVLAGAKAGVTYGAHGLWGWHRRGLPFGSTAFSGLPLPWQEALRLPGAWDAGYARWIVESFGLAAVEPVDLPEVSPEIRVAASGDGKTVGVYLPYPAELRTGRDLSRHEVFLVNLADRAIVRPTLRHERDGSVLAMPEVNSDLLLVARA